MAGATTCAAGQVCNPATDMCVTACTGCVIGGVCYGPDTTNPTNQCQICRTATPTVWTPNTGATCNDGLFCTAVDTCNSSAVCTGTTRNCSDGAACSGVETCNESTDRCDAGTTTCPAGQTCDVPTDTCIITCAGCVIGGVCYAPGTLNGCLECDTLRSTTAWSNRPDLTACDDREYCTVMDRCISGACVGGGPRDCADTITCTTETCNETNDSCDAAGSTCPAGQFCSTAVVPTGMCSSTCLGTICTAVPPATGSVCVDTATNPDYCGSCSNQCPARANTTRLCGGSPASCMYACQSGFLDCNGGTDGCEVNRLTDSNNCGSCGNVCPVGAPFCSAGTCIATAGAFAIPFAPVAMTAPTSVTLTDDSLSGVIPLGFSFVYFGNTYTQLRISSNGWLAFGASGTPFTTRTIPSPSDGVNDAIYFNNTDLNPANGGTIEYSSQGAAGSRLFIVTFTAVRFFSGAGTLTSQVILYEGSNRIEVHTTSQPGGRPWTQGVENAAGTTAYFLPGRVNADYALAGDGVRFITN